MKNSFRKIACLLVILSTVFMLSVAVSAAADELKFEEVVYAEFTDGDKSDEYAFTLTSQNKVIVNISTKVRPYTVAIVDTEGNEKWSKTVKKGLFETPSEATNVIVSEAIEAGDYELIISTTSKGSYKFNAALNANISSSTDNDKNNAFTDAKEVLLETSTKGMIKNDKEEDYYRFTVPANGTVTFDFLAKMEYHSAFLYAENESQLWSVVGKQWNAKKKASDTSYTFNLNAGTYYLKINGYNKIPAFLSPAKTYKGDYQFELYFKEVKGNEVEPNDSLVEAKKINLNSAVNGFLSFTDSQDTYTVKLEKGTTLLTFTSYMNSYNVTVYDELNKEKWSSKDNAKDAKQSARYDLHKITLEAGKYYIRVNGGTGKYSMLLTKPIKLDKVPIEYYSRTITTITLEWAEVEGALGYEVFKYNATKKEYERVGSTADTILKVKNLASATKYKFAVRPFVKINGVIVPGEMGPAREVITAPKKISIKSVTGGKKKATVAWTAAERASGYQIYYATNKYFDNEKKVLVKDAKALRKVIKGLKGTKSGKKYYVKVRAYTTFKNKRIYSTSFSAVKSVRVKK